MTRKQCLIIQIQNVYSELTLENRRTAAVEGIERKILRGVQRAFNYRSADNLQEAEAGADGLNRDPVVRRDADRALRMVRKRKMFAVVSICVLADVCIAGTRVEVKMKVRGVPKRKTCELANKSNNCEFPAEP